MTDKFTCQALFYDIHWSDIKLSIAYKLQWCEHFIFLIQDVWLETCQGCSNGYFVLEKFWTVQYQVKQCAQWWALIYF